VVVELDIATSVVMAALVVVVVAHLAVVALASAVLDLILALMPQLDH
jgi:hypothetical protein